MLHRWTARTPIALLALTLIAGSLFGCGGGGGGGGGGGNGNGTLSVVMTDCADPTVSALNVTITRVEAHVGNDWVTITSVPKSFNLFDLVRQEAALGTTPLPAGHYTQIRFFPSSAMVMDNMGSHTCDIPGADQTGVKVNVDYDIRSDEVTTVLLDFNVCKSLRKRGNGTYFLQPVIPAVVKVMSGTISGTVAAGGSPQKGAEVTAVYTAGSSYPVGTEVNSSVTLSDGTFRIWALMPGTYKITATYTNPSTNATTTAVKTGLVVTANQDTSAGTLALQ